MGEIWVEYYSIVIGMIGIVLETWFYTRMIGEKVKPIHGPVLLAAGGVLLAVSYHFQSFMVDACSMILYLWCYGEFGFRCGRKESFFSGALAVEIMVLCAGISNALTGLFSPLAFYHFRTSGGIFLMIVGNLTALCLAVICYQLLLQRFSWEEDEKEYGGSAAFMPMLLILFIGGYVGYFVYGNTVTVDGQGRMEGVDHYQMLILLILCIISVFSVLDTCRKLSEKGKLDLKLSMLEQQHQDLVMYGKEARLRYEETRAFRHDIKNHLLVVKGLVDEGKAQEAAEYLKKLEMTAAKMNGLYHTGRSAVDILLSGKLALAADRGIEVECEVKIPQSCSIEDMDFCILFANVLDNAIRACEELGDTEKRYITISDRKQGGIYLIEIENSCAAAGNKEGLGLSNVRAVAEKYQGTVNIERRQGSFCVDILLLWPLA